MTVVLTPAQRDGSLHRGPEELPEIHYMQSSHMMSTISALRRRRTRHQIQGVAGQSCNAKESHDEVTKARKEMISEQGLCSFALHPEGFAAAILYHRPTLQTGKWCKIILDNLFPINNEPSVPTSEIADTHP